MSAFIAAALSLPTVVFTVLLGFFLIYSLLTLVGALDLEWLDGLLGVDDVADGGTDSPLQGGLQALGVAGIPLTLFGGVACIFAWLLCFAGMQFLPGSTLVKVGVGLGSAVAGVLAGAIAVRPFRSLFITPDGPHRKELVGRICTIRSLRVNDRSGTADVGDLVAEVRCFRENELTVGSKAIVYDYDSNENAYHVGPIDPTIVI